MLNLSSNDQESLGKSRVISFTNRDNRTSLFLIHNVFISFSGLKTLNFQKNILNKNEEKYNLLAETHVDKGEYNDGVRITQRKELQA